MKKMEIRLKTPDEIKKIAEGGKIIAEIFNAITRMPLDGMSTWELDSRIDDFILKNHARAAFKTISGYNYASCVSINSEAAHGVPHKKKLLKNTDIVKIDTGVAFQGYFSDACYTFTVGDVSPEARKLVNAAKTALQLGIGEIRPGGKSGNIGFAIQEYAESLGYSVARRFTGHGVGYALHEAPVIPHYGEYNSGFTLKEGMVLAIEPVINEGCSEVKTLDDGWTTVTADGKLSAQFEHTVAVTKEGPVVLTGGNY
ncbi:MAG: type I methionyl aminopeptidase [bacterium]|nr:type I methionyl aminopeptidase [bacterium]